MKYLIFLLLLSTISCEKIYHGVNVVYKGEPWLPNLSDFNSKDSFMTYDYKLLNNMGFNIVRFGLMWPGVMPTPTLVDYNYLNQIKMMINKLNEYNISVILEPHQDLLSTFFCGEGVPDWTINGTIETFPFPLSLPYKTSPPSPYDCTKRSWVLYQTTLDASKAYQNFYTEGTLLYEQFINYWRIVSDYFKDVDNIYGYEIINEPWIGDYYNNPDLVIPKNANKNINRLYQSVIKTIRDNEVNCNKKILFEPVTFTVLGKMGFNLTDVCNNLELSYHGYFPPNIDIESMFSYHHKLNISTFLTEFDYGSGDKNINKALKLLDLADIYKQSWTVWEYKTMFGITGANKGFFNKDGTFTSGVSTLSRPYAQVVNGEILSMNFNNNTKDFFLEYNRGLDIDDTRIYLGNIHYPNGYNISLTGANITAIQNGYLYLRENNNNVRLIINP